MQRRRKLGRKGGRPTEAEVGINDSQLAVRQRRVTGGKKIGRIPEKPRKKTGGKRPLKYNEMPGPTFDIFQGPSLAPYAPAPVSASDVYEEKG